MDKTLFKFKTDLRVRNYEIDWQGVVHNANYLRYFEVGRMEYLENLGLKIDLSAIRKESRIVVARNEIDYLSPSAYGETLNVYTRISSIRGSSFVFEGLLEESRSGRGVGENVSIHVWLDPRTDEPRTIPDDFRRLVQHFEKESVAIEWPTYLA